MKDPDALSHKQHRFLQALFVTPSLDSAAKQAGIAPVTGWRWMRQAAFKAAYCEARQEVVQHAIVLLQLLASLAVSTLAQVMADREAPPASRVAACKVVLEMSLRGVELEMFAQRLEALERARSDDDP